jgi:hypothetical protein
MSLGNHHTATGATVQLRGGCMMRILPSPRSLHVADTPYPLCWVASPAVPHQGFRLRPVQFGGSSAVTNPRAQVRPRQNAFTPPSRFDARLPWVVVFPL